MGQERCHERVIFIHEHSSVSGNTKCNLFELGAKRNVLASEICLINEEFFVVVDGLKVNGNICLSPAKPTTAPGSPGTVYSYNQGLLLRGMSDLAKKANDTREEQELLELAINLTSGSMAWLSKGSRLGIIQDPMWNDCNGPMFKGVYLRYLGYVATWFAGKAPSHFHRVSKFVAIQTWAVWHIARKIGLQMSPTLRSDTSLFWASWRGTRSGSRVVYNSTYPVFIPQTSALDAFNTGVIYQKISSLTTTQLKKETL